MKNKYQPLDFLVVKSIKIIASYINFQNIHFTNLTIKIKFPLKLTISCRPWLHQFYISGSTRPGTS